MTQSALQEASQNFRSETSRPRAQSRFSSGKADERLPDICPSHSSQPSLHWANADMARFLLIDGGAR
jgi:hypothetical protein